MKRSTKTISMGTSSLKFSTDPKSDPATPEVTVPKTTVCNIVNDLKSNYNVCTEQSQKLNNNTKELQNDHESKERDENENRLPKLKINLTNIDQNQLVNDLAKLKSPIDDKNSSKLVFTHQKEGGVRFPDSNKQKQPIMGRKALLKKANIDPDSLIIQSMILNKYENVINHYVSRMYKRRSSKQSTSEDDCESSSSPYSVFTPSSLSPADTPASLSGETRNRFEFPTVGEYRYPFFAANYYVPKRNLDFLKSTDDFNVETTTEPNDSLTSSDIGQEGSTTSASEYDPKTFLENALGDLSSFTPSELGDKADCASMNSLSCSEIVGPSNVSTLLSSAGSLYSSLRKSIKRRRHSFKTVSFEDHQISLPNRLLESLEKELSIQNSIIFQISKALNYCRSSKDFFSGKEHIEAEKILLLATITKAALTSEINTIEFNTYETSSDPRCYGDIKITDVAFHLKEKVTVLPHHADSKEYFVAVAASGKKIICSEISEAKDHVIPIRKCFEFDNLLADFEISISVYSMTIRNKVHIIQENMKCPSPKSILRCTKEPRRHKSINKTLYIEPLAFTLVGKCFIRNKELSKPSSTIDSSLKLHTVPPHSSIAEKIDFKIDHAYHLTNKTSGFLTIGIENEQLFTTWNRRWCLLEGSDFKYWNYPSEEIAAPLGNINLCFSKAQKVIPADRTICARPRTLMIPIQNDTSEKRYLLSADTIEGLKMWENELNFVIKSLMIWNGMECLPVE
nr:anillin-like protein 1 isoform X1 [Leptinotarsa decemlineata]XP_023018131.1 anillin-like protein 1 isoform X1 [Leptinotarsa decemlineata]XP_023018132.1 anillin-like protein 1 isoform X1 [Leptinotarsa decemlineata]XP_023018133.1 anillin-like protein 1 isoform X1 [Leptinotarsa decemlineata]